MKEHRLSVLQNKVLKEEQEAEKNFMMRMFMNIQVFRDIILCQLINS